MISKLVVVSMSSSLDSSKVNLDIDKAGPHKSNAVLEVQYDSHSTSYYTVLDATAVPSMDNCYFDYGPIGKARAFADCRARRGLW